MYVSHISPQWPSSNRRDRLEESERRHDPKKKRYIPENAGKGCTYVGEAVPNLSRSRTEQSHGMV